MSKDFKQNMVLVCLQIVSCCRRKKTEKDWLKLIKTGYGANGEDSFSLTPLEGL